MFTARFSEQWELIGKIEVASHSTEQNTGRILISEYRRIAVEIFGADGGAQTVDVDMEQANAATGGTLKALDSNNKDTVLAAAEYIRIVEIKQEEFDTNTGGAQAFRYLNVEATPSGARVCGVHVWGLPVHLPPANTLVDEIVD